MRSHRRIGEGVRAPRIEGGSGALECQRRRSAQAWLTEYKRVARLGERGARHAAPTERASGVRL